MKLYHGTDKRFRTPDLEECYKHTDFGKGFYLTHELERAKEWGKYHNPVKYRVNIYEIGDDYIEKAKLSGLNVKVFHRANEEWARFVYNNRYVDDFRHEYDIVIGPVADNALQQHFTKMHRDVLSFEQIAPQIKYEKFKKPQICFCTERSIERLNYIQANAYPYRTSHKRRRR